MAAVDPSTGLTRLRTSLERAATGGAPSVGQWMEFPGFTLARTIASTGCDWVLIDCEHGNIDDAAMYHAVAGVVMGGASPVVRIAGSEQWMVKRALDAGAHGIMVPMVHDAEQARAVASFAHYPNPKTFPSGQRGCGGLFANASFNLNGADYLRQANTRITVIVQIESPQGVANASSIAAVDGIDALFIGPNDLASSMGYFAFDHPKIPKVQEASASVLRAAKEKGKFAGHFCLGADEAARRVGQGWHFANCGADLVALTAWMGSEMARMKEIVQGGKTNGVDVKMGEGGYDGVKASTKPVNGEPPITNGTLKVGNEAVNEHRVLLQADEAGDWDGRDWG